MGCHPDAQKQRRGSAALYFLKAHHETLFVVDMFVFICQEGPKQILAHGAVNLGNILSTCTVSGGCTAIPCIW